MGGNSHLISNNRKARHYYELLDFVEAGLVLLGSEVKSLRLGRVNFLDSYVDFRQGEAWLVGMHSAPYTLVGSHDAHGPDRRRKLLLRPKSAAWPPGQPGRD